MNRSSAPKLAGLLSLVAFSPLSSFAQSSYDITFDEPGIGLEHGSFFTGNEYSSLGGGVTFTVNSNGSFDQLAVFDTLAQSTRDPDLEAPFVAGNLQGLTNLGNALIIAENINGANNNGLIDNPDDEILGGTIRVAFGNPQVQSVGFSLYDTPETANSQVSIVFRDTSGNSTTWTPNDLLSHGSNVAFGNASANKFEDITATQLGLQNIQSIDFNIESGALDSLTFETVPEPSSAVLLGLGSAGLLFRRKRLS